MLNKKYEIARQTASTIHCNQNEIRFGIILNLPVFQRLVTDQRCRFDLILRSFISIYLYAIMRLSLELDVNSGIIVPKTGRGCHTLLLGYTMGSGK